MSRTESDGGTHLGVGVGLCVLSVLLDETNSSSSNNNNNNNKGTMRNDGSNHEVLVPLFGVELRLAQDTTRMDHAYSVWDASVVLAKYLEKNAAWARKQIGPTQTEQNGEWIVELGAGCGGLLSLAAAFLFAGGTGGATGNAHQHAPSIVATDLRTTLPLLRRNLDVNIGAARVNQTISSMVIDSHELDWTQKEHADDIIAARGGRRARAIVAADCVYQVRSALFAQRACKLPPGMLIQSHGHHRPPRDHNCDIRSLIFLSYSRRLLIVPPCTHT